MKIPQSALTVALLLASSYATALPTVGSSYTLTDLGTLGGPFSSAYDINNAGQIVGITYTSYNPYLISYESVVYQYSNGVMSNLGTPNYPSNSVSKPSINDLGQIASGSYLYNGAVWNQVSSGIITDINNSGQLVGYASDISGLYQYAFVYNEGVITNLGTFGGYRSQAIAINDAGQVVGLAETTERFDPAQNGLAEHAFLYNGNEMIDLGTLGGIQSWASDINNDGQIIGSSYNSSGRVHAFLYSDGAMVDLGALGTSWSFAYGINSLGHVVGSSIAANQAEGKNAFLYSDGLMIDLNDLISPDSGWDLDEAWAINDSGQIVGYGFNGSEFHGFLLTPSAVPLPASIWLFATGLIALFGVAKRKSYSC